MGGRGVARAMLAEAHPVIGVQPDVQILSGTVFDVGTIEWWAAKDLPFGEWSEVFETPGSWSFIRVLSRPDEWHPRAEVEIERVSVDYLDTLLTEVQDSVDAGHDLETTQATVTMEDYQGYALWDWVHTWVNLPAAHTELSP